LNDDLPGTAPVAKDFHVVRAIRALAALDAAPFALVFGGGTALARAHRLVRRMSEDVDFKIVPLPAAPVSRSGLHRQRSALRGRVTAALPAAGFTFDPKDPAQARSRDESSYMVWQLPYSPPAGAGEELRPRRRSPPPAAGPRAAPARAGAALGRGVPKAAHGVPQARSQARKQGAGRISRRPGDEGSAGSAGHGQFRLQRAGHSVSMGLRGAPRELGTSARPVAAIGYCRMSHPRVSGSRHRPSRADPSAISTVYQRPP
jgi:hypothetical protein